MSISVKQYSASDYTVIEVLKNEMAQPSAQNVGPVQIVAGPEGPQGPTGETGKTPNIQIGEVVTLEAGTEATASITGTQEEPRLNLGIPKGDPGEPGEGGNAEVTAESIEAALGYKPANEEDIPEVPVQSVNGKNGAVQLAYGDVGAEKAGAVAEHNVDENAHNDIRVELTGLKNALEAFLDIDDPTLDQLSELIQKIEANAGTITELTNGKVNVADIVNDLVTNVANKPLSAAQGVVLKGLVDDVGDAAFDAFSIGSEAINRVLEVESEVDAVINTSVRFDIQQNLSETYKAQARANIGIVGTGEDGEPGKSAFQSAVEGGYAGTEEEFYNALANSGKAEINVPMFNLGTLGLTPISIFGGEGVLETDTTDIVAAFEKGLVTFVVPVDVDGQTANVTIVTNPANAMGSYQSIALINFTELATVTVNVEEGMLRVIIEPLALAQAEGVGF